MGITADDLSQEPSQFRIPNSSFKNSQEYLVIDTVKEFFDIALEHPACTHAILAHGVGEYTETIHRGVCPLPVAARERVGDEGLVEIRFGQRERHVHP